MKVAVFNTQSYVRASLEAVDHSQHEWLFIENSLSSSTVAKATGCHAVCCFVTDQLDAPVLEALSQLGIKNIVLRSAGYDHVDLKTATLLGMTVVNVPEYSPQAVAEFAVALLLTLTRKLRESFQKTLLHDFTLEESILGCNLYEKTVGIIGTGHIGTAFAKIMSGFGCRLLGFDPYPNAVCTALGVTYVSLEKLLKESQVVSLHCLLNQSTRHIINQPSLNQMNKEAILINTGRGALIDTSALLHALKNGCFHGVALDVYEGEKGLFFVDHTGEKIQDSQFNQLQNFSNVVITGHQAFFTKEAIMNIAKTTVENLNAIDVGKPINQVN